MIEILIETLSNIFSLLLQMLFNIFCDMYKKSLLEVEMCACGGKDGSCNEHGWKIDTYT